MKYEPPVVEFAQAVPVWPQGLKHEMNLLVGFRGRFQLDQAKELTLRITACTLYRAYINGAAVSYGPARAAHGYARVDEKEIYDFWLRGGTNEIAIEVSSYNIDTFCHAKQLPFLQFELLDGDKVLLASGDDRITAFRRHERVQRVQRYSIQRAFLEVYRFDRPCRWQMQDIAKADRLKLEQVEQPCLLPRRAPYPDLTSASAYKLIGTGTASLTKPEKLWKDRSLTQAGGVVGGFCEDDLDVISSIELQHVAFHPGNAEPVYEDDMLRLGEGQYVVFDYGRDITGCIALNITADESVRLFLIWDEVLSEGDVDFKRWSSANIIDLTICSGEHFFESIEPYTLKYLKVYVHRGSCTFQAPSICTVMNGELLDRNYIWLNDAYVKVFMAARHTAFQNAVDLPMDCPGRERAAYLCDSLFTCRAIYSLSANLSIETDFLENYLLPDGFEHIPNEMFPMCYPADHPRGEYIPNWALFLVLQIEEYKKRGGEPAIIDGFKEKFAHLFAYFARFENEFGLLEDLEGWVFVEWSKANDFIDGVNYPTNMLYAAALCSAGRLCDRAEWTRKGEQLKRTVREQAFDGEFFVDQALRKDGRLVRTQNRSEVCQYFAFTFGVAQVNSHRELFDILLRDFSHRRKENGLWPEIHPVNAFIGHMLRMELLVQHGHISQFAEEIRDYYLPMAEQTGTLWEFDTTFASCAHGFNSYLCTLMQRAFLCVERFDPEGGRVVVRFRDNPLDECTGSLPIGEQETAFSWKKKDGAIHYSVFGLPEGALEVRNETNWEAIFESDWNFH